MEICVEREGKRELLSIPEFEKAMEIAFIPQLDFDFPTLHDICKRSQKLHRKGALSREQLWLGQYFRTEILSGFCVSGLAICWIDPVIGWGVFADRDFKEMEFIAEYAGVLRRRHPRADRKNAYCFEYLVAGGVKSPYAIDAREQGGIARFINHSATPNLASALATVDHIPHILFIAKEPIPKGAQLSYDYGPGYWSLRGTPQKL